MENIVVVPLRKVIFDVILLMCVGFPILFLFLWGEPFQRGFFCSDESLKHPYHDSTVPSIYLYIFGLGLPCAVMLLTEYITSESDENQKQLEFAGYRIPTWLWQSYCVIGIFAFGAACSQLTTDVLKYAIGRLRPHFYTVCLPNINCSIPSNMYKYHTDFICTNPAYINNTRIIKEVSLSFPSGHSSFSMYTMIYFAIYLQSRMTWDGSKLLRHTIQFLAILSSLFTGMTRISDYKHHWSDVLIGFLIGSTTACLVGYLVGNLQSKKPTSVNNSYIRSYQAILLS